MKKFMSILALLCTVIICACVLTACFKEDPTDKDSQDPDSVTEGDAQDNQEGETEFIQYSKVTFTGLDDDVIAVVMLKTGDEIIPPQAPEYEGYVFKGWDMKTSVVTGDMTVRAIYKKLLTYTVNYYIPAAEGYILSSSCTAELAEGEREADTLSVEFFKENLPQGYSLAADFVIPQGVAEEDKTIDVYCSVQQFSVIVFNTPQGNGYQSFTVEYGQIFKPDKPYACGYVFEGWYSDEQCRIPYLCGPVQEDKAVYSKWNSIDENTVIELVLQSDIDNLYLNPGADYILKSDLSGSALAEKGIVFGGTLDGEGHCISTEGRELFSEITGEVHDLYVEATGQAQICDTDINECFGVLCGVNTGIVSGVNINAQITLDVADRNLFIGGVCGINSGSVKDCDVNVDFIVNGNENTFACIGGIAGEFRGDTTVSSCTVSFVADATCGELYCGAIAGRIVYLALVTDVIADESVVTASEKGCIGGVFGAALSLPREQWNSGIVVRGTLSCKGNSSSGNVVGKNFGTGEENFEKIDVSGLTLTVTL